MRFKQEDDLELVYVLVDDPDGFSHQWHFKISETSQYEFYPINHAMGLREILSNSFLRGALTKRYTALKQAVTDIGLEFKDLLNIDENVYALAFRTKEQAVGAKLAYVEPE